MRKLPFGVYLLIFELVVVEADPLQVQNEVVGQTRYQASLRGVSLLLAVAALVV